MTAGVATSDPRATDVAAGVLETGGSAVDAAVAAALVLYVVEPQQCGPGGDAFLIHVGAGSEPVALDGSGEIPAGLDDDALAAAGLDTVPARGPLSATVPGALRLLETALAHHGRRTLPDLVGPAVDLAREGFEVRPTLAQAATSAASSIADDPVLGPLYVPGGEPVAVGDTVVNPTLADVLEAVATHGTDLLHGGDLGRAVTARLQEAGGVLAEDDIAEHRTTPIELVTASFRGSTIWELPPPTQGPAVVGALETIENDLDSVSTPEQWRTVVDIMDASLRDAGFDLSQIGPRPSPAKGDTTYIAVVDHDGNGASLITSVFGDFGAHFGIPELGAAIGNRATMLRALRRPMAPGAKPPHTTIPAAVTAGGVLSHVLGVAGGFMQPQAQVQVLIRMLEHGLDPQDAIDAPRFRIGFGGTLSLEAGHPLCDSMPEAAARQPGPEGFGAAQVVRAARTNEALAAGADHRRGGSARVLG